MDNDVREILKRQLERLDKASDDNLKTGPEQLARIADAMCAIVSRLTALDCLPATFADYANDRAKRREDDKAAEAATPTPAVRNLNWAALLLPKDCHSIFVCMDGELFDTSVENGMAPLHDGRRDASVPCFIAGSPASDPEHLGIAATNREATSGEAR